MAQRKKTADTSGAFWAGLAGGLAPRLASVAAHAVDKWIRSQHGDELFAKLGTVRGTDEITRVILTAWGQQ